MALNNFDSKKPVRFDSEAIPEPVGHHQVVVITFGHGLTRDREFSSEANTLAPLRGLACLQVIFVVFVAFTDVVRAHRAAEGEAWISFTAIFGEVREDLVVAIILSRSGSVTTSPFEFVASSFSTL